jgi:hypothetical protein
MANKHHYIPQHFLRGFCSEDTPGKLWVYIKGEERVYAAGTHKIARANEFYLDEVEQTLSVVFEGPMKDVLRKIRTQDLIDDAERKTIAAYVALLLKRVPAYRDIVRNMAPEVFAAEFSRRRKEIADEVEDRDVREACLNEFDHLQEAWADAIPESVLHFAEQPWTTGIIENKLMGMHWYYLVASRDLKYVVGDNPVFFFTLVLNSP